MVQKIVQKMVQKLVQKMVQSIFYPMPNNPSIMVLSRNHEQHGQFYFVCMIWYLDEAKLWQLSVEKHISLTVNSFALTQLRYASVAHQAYCCKNTLIILDRNANLKREK